MKNNNYNFNDEPNLPLDNNGKNSFGLPEDYFLMFENKLKKKIELENELNEFPLLSSIQKVKAFTVPPDYFKLSINSLEYKTELEAYLKLQSIEKPVLIGLEEDYKQQLQLAINHKIEIAEELKDYKTLYSLSKENSFIVPENYFEGVTDNVKSRIYNVNENRKSIVDI